MAGRSKNGADSPVDTLEPPVTLEEGAPVEEGSSPEPEAGDTLDIRSLHEMNMGQLTRIAKDLRWRTRRNAQTGPDLQNPAGPDRAARA